MTLLRQIQDELAASNADIAAVLRKCKILARRLHSANFGQWVDWELNGYPEYAEVPTYRIVHPTHWASFSNGYWSVERQPISPLLIEKEYRHHFEPIAYRAGIESVKALSQEGGTVQRSEFRFLLTGKVVDLPCIAFWSQLSSVELKQIISTVSSRLLDFAMDIEAENPNAGEAPLSELPVPPEKVQQLVQNHFHGPVGNVALNSSGFSQSATLNLERVREVTAAVRSQLAKEPLKKSTQTKVKAELAKIESELAARKPNESVVREAGRSLRTIVEGAIAATVVQPSAWQRIAEMLGSLFGS
jgi:hypothetical protein